MRHNATLKLVAASKLIEVRNGGVTLPELSSRRRYLVLAICCLSLFIAGTATLMIVTSSPTMNRLMQQIASTSIRRERLSAPAVTNSLY